MPRLRLLVLHREGQTERALYHVRRAMNIDVRLGDSTVHGCPSLPQISVLARPIDLREPLQAALPVLRIRRNQITTRERDRLEGQRVCVDAISAKVRR